MNGKLVALRNCPSSIWASFTLLLLFVSSQLASAQTSALPSQQKSERVQVERDALKNETRIYIPAKNGKVHWIDITESIMRHVDKDADVFDLSVWKSKSGAIDLNSRASRVSLLAADVAMGERLDFVVLRNPQRLLIRVRNESNSNFDLAKSKLRQIVLRRNNGLKDAYGISLPDLETKPHKARQNDVCLFVHGLHSHCDGMLPLAEKVRALGYRIAFFDYPNDDRIAASAKFLSQELKKVKHENPKLKIHIIGHSMGGLVARKTVEEKSLDPGNVASLIMIATPNHGSDLAKIAHGLDIWEHFLDEGDQTSVMTKIKSSIADGLNGAAKDLRPESKFLRELNQLERNPNVQYSNLIGIDAVVSTRTIRTFFRKASRYIGLKVANQAMAYVGMKIQNLDEIVSGLGDGMVSVKSAMIGGVSDVEQFKLTHRQMWLEPKEEESQKLFGAVIKRLE